MKSITVLLMTLLSLTSLANTIIVEGSLIDDIVLDGPIRKMIFTAQKKELKLDLAFNEVENCSNGRFIVSLNEDGSNTLEEIVNCEEFYDETQEIKLCPEVFSPVCAEVPAYGKALPKLVTFPNSCEMYKQRANFINQGRCN